VGVIEKQLDSLVDDIYELLEKGSPSGAPTQQYLDEFAEAIKQAATSYMSPREGKRTLRISAIGKPDRKLYYDIRGSGSEPEKFKGHELFKFFYGHIIEAALIYLTKEAGHKVEDEQREVILGGVVGHMDCKIDGVVTDVKSASTYGFKKFQYGTLEEDDAFGYMEQLAGYVAADGTNEGAFLAADKTLGHIALLRVPQDKLEGLKIEDRIEYLKEMLKSDDVPPRCYDPVPEGKSGNLALPTGCSYCAHKFDCYSEANGGVGLRTFIYSTGPKYLTHIEKEPNVMEATFARRI
jgi:hypothetical protein